MKQILTNLLFPKAEINIQPEHQSSLPYGFLLTMPSLPYKRQTIHDQQENERIKKKKLDEGRETLILANDKSKFPIKKTKPLRKSALIPLVDDQYQIQSEIKLQPKHQIKTLSSVGSQAIEKINNKLSEKPKISASSLPMSKIKLHYIQNNNSLSEKTVFSKLYEIFYPGYCFSSMTVSSEKRLKDNFEIYNHVNEDFGIEELSYISDSFITPEESPLIQASPDPLNNPVVLESPLIHSIQTPSIEGWGTEKNIGEMPSPQFTKLEESGGFEQENEKVGIKPTVLFPPLSKIPEEDDKFVKKFEVGKDSPLFYKANEESDRKETKSSLIEVIENSIKKSEQKIAETIETPRDKNEILITQPNEELVKKNEVLQTQLNEYNFKKTEEPEVLMELLPSKEASANFENAPIYNPYIQVKNESSNFLDLSHSHAKEMCISPVTENKSYQEMPTPSPSSNPFLNVKAAETFKPLYVFGSGGPAPSINTLSNINPFLA
ncbi:hypothetical protein SteCoe_21317 [Stentor coeruleus]|uniref:Uncharacterized protein n=1 Tax=Stentor coeruleus TaxID=5963 RepID=A0A1R2BQ07_9CILI|nr:hypothetical protein SteCoe_21317 [Stentor coeruleus]